jgi:hypothetical protein
MLDPGFPCSYCGVRSDVACRHRPAEPRIVVDLPDGLNPADGRLFSGPIHKANTRAWHMMRARNK